MQAIRCGAILGLAGIVLSGCNPAMPTTSRPEGGVAQTAEATKVESDLTAKQVAEVRAITQAPPPKAAARATPARLDTTTAAQKAAAAKPAEVPETRLGSTVASLGDPTEGGFWIKTPLVKTRGVGRLVNPANGKSAKVDLIPLDGPASGGSQVSLPALQLLGVSLTDLPTLDVFRS